MIVLKFWSMKSGRVMKWLNPKTRLWRIKWRSNWKTISFWKVIYKKSLIFTKSIFFKPNFVIFASFFIFKDLIISESDYDIVFERIFNFIRMQNPSLSFISTFNITSSHIIPHILITCYSACRNLDYQTSKEIFYQLNTRVLGYD